jgi:putative ABC transport system ATP-binding protein
MISGRSRSSYKDKLDECLKIIGMEDKRKLTPRELSGGQQQRVAIARALVFDPKIIFLDEPIGNLDTKTGMRIMELFREINQKYNKTIVQVTHSERAAKFGTKLIKLVDGEIEAIEPILN